MFLSKSNCRFEAGLLTKILCLAILLGISITQVYADDDTVRDMGSDDYTSLDRTDLSRDSKDDRDDYDKGDDDDDDRAHDSLTVDKKPFEKTDWTSDFIDTDFRKESFLNSFEREKPKRYADDRKVKRDEPSYRDEDDKHKSDLVKWMKRKPDSADYTDSKDDQKVLKELKKPIRGMLHDWVPQRADRLHNGGFEIEPDNGFPVPYRLNGHLDIQRKLPWEKEPQ